MKYFRLPLDTLIRIKKIITCFVAQKNADFSAAWEKHDFQELIYVRSGCAVSCFDSQKIVLHPGDAILHGPNVPHMLCGNGKEPLDFFIVTFECDSPALPSLYGRSLSVPRPCRPLLEALYAEKVQGLTEESHRLNLLPDAPIGCRQMIGLYLEQFLILLLRSEQEKENSRIFTSRKALEAKVAEDLRSYLETCLYEKIDIDQLCARFHYGKSHLCGAFRALYGDSIMHWFLCRKIDEASRLLRESDESISVISDRLQFDSPQYFSRIFRRYTGLCPREYRATDHSAFPAT